MEDLSFIRERLDYGKYMNRRLHSWAFARLQGRIEDKATEAGVPVRFVNPAYTSKTCHACGRIGRRGSQAEFRCMNDDCHVSEFQAEINASANIARRVDPWGESVPWKPERDDSPQDGSGSDTATVHRKTSDYEISASHDEYSVTAIAGPIDVSHGSERVDVTMSVPNDGDDGTGDENETDEGNETETHTLTVRTPGAPDGTTITVQREAGPDEESDPITKASTGGQASFNVPPGHYHVEADGYNPTMVPIEVGDDTEITLQQPGPDPIQVTVVDAETDEPIEGAEISGLCQLWYSSGDVYVTGTTDANGVAQAQAGVVPTECNARVEADGYETTHLSLSVPDDDGITVEMTPAPADDGGTDNRTADESQTAVQAIA